MVYEGGIILGKPRRVGPDVFFSNKDEEDLDSFIIALAAWFNDLKTYQLHGIQAETRLLQYKEAIQNGLPSKEKEMEARLSYSHYNHASRLIASHIVELFEAINENVEHLKHPTFHKASNSILLERQQFLNIVIRCATGDLAPGEATDKFIKMKNLFVRMRSSGTYHYYKTKYFRKGYLHFFQQQEGNDPYYCLSESPGGTRFFFADRVQEEIMRELETNYRLEAIHEFAGLAQHAIKDLVESYIVIKEKEIRQNKINKWMFTSVK